MPTLERTQVTDTGEFHGTSTLAAIRSILRHPGVYYRYLRPLEVLTELLCAVEVGRLGPDGLERSPFSLGQVINAVSTTGQAVERFARQVVRHAPLTLEPTTPLDRVLHPFVDVDFTWSVLSLDCTVIDEAIATDGTRLAEVAVASLGEGHIFRAAEFRAHLPLVGDEDLVDALRLDELVAVRRFLHGWRHAPGDCWGVCRIKSAPRIGTPCAPACARQRSERTCYPGTSPAADPRRGQTRPGLWSYRLRAHR